MSEILILPALEAVKIFAGILAVIGAVGLFRFPDVYTRIHACTIVTVGGVCLALIALIIENMWTVYALKAFIVLVLIFFTDPTATHAIAYASFRTGTKPAGLSRNDASEFFHKFEAEHKKESEEASKEIKENSGKTEKAGHHAGGKK